LIHSTIVLDECLNTVLRIVVARVGVGGAFSDTSSTAMAMSLKHSRCPIAMPFGQPLVERTGDTTLWTRFPLHDKAGGAFTELIVIRPPSESDGWTSWTSSKAWRFSASVAIENARFHTHGAMATRGERPGVRATGAAQPAPTVRCRIIKGYCMAIRSGNLFTRWAATISTLCPWPMERQRLWWPTLRARGLGFGPGRNKVSIGVSRHGELGHTSG